LFFLQKVRIIDDARESGTWKVSALSYEYNIERRKDGQEILAFHWEGHEAKNPMPHLHIGFAAQHKNLPLGPKNHIPSGRVLVEDVVHFLIDELKVSPTKHRRNSWRAIISKTRQAVMKFKTW
jgi:hypothetical protein